MVRLIEVPWAKCAESGRVLASQQLRYLYPFAHHCTFAADSDAACVFMPDLCLHQWPGFAKILAMGSGQGQTSAWQSFAPVLSAEVSDPPFKFSSPPARRLPLP